MFAAATVLVLLGLAAPVWPADPVKLQVFYSTLCPDSMRFVTTQLYPTWSKYKKFIDLDVNTYGKANITWDGDEYNFSCQSGPRECEGNLLINCAQKHVTNMDKFMAFSYCIMDNGVAAEAASECADEAGIDLSGEIDTCRTSKEGLELHKITGEKQMALDPPLHYVPWIIVGDEFSDANLEAAQKDLVKLIKSEYKGDDWEDCGK